MAAFLTDRLLSPHAVPVVAAFSPTPRVTRRRSIDLFVMVHGPASADLRSGVLPRGPLRAPPRSGKSRFCHHAM
jgi:hypothetical protein